VVHYDYIKIIDTIYSKWNSIIKISGIFKNITPIKVLSSKVSRNLTDFVWNYFQNINNLILK